MSKVYVNGAYSTKFGELWERDLRSLAVEAAVEAVKDSGLTMKDIDSIVVGNMLASRFAGQDHVGALIASELGISVPASHSEAACASGGTAFRQGWMEILSGQAENVLVVGVEKMNDIGTDEVTTGLSGASDEEWEASVGVTFPSLYAMIAREHMRKYKTTSKDLSLIALKNHMHGSMNPKAQFPKEITLDMAQSAIMVADPLNLMDCSPITDGASAIVLSNKKKKKSIEVLSVAQAQDTLALHDREDITTIGSTVKAANKAFEMAKVQREEIGLIELHDCFTIAELVALEDLGFAKKGEGVKLVRNGDTYYDAKLPVNTSGGLKACGHPVGATGIKQIVEVYDQMNERVGARQVKDLKYALTHNVGGSGATAVVSIFKNLNNA